MLSLWCKAVSDLFFSISNSPKYTYTVKLDYDSLDDFFANIEITGSDAYFEENTHEEKRNAYNVVNASFGYRYENWTFTIWSKNLFDRGYEDRVFFFNNYCLVFANW